MARRRQLRERDIPSAATPATEATGTAPAARLGSPKTSASSVEPSTPGANGLRRWLPPLLLVLLTAGLWARTLAAPLYHWDDNVYIFKDPRIATLSWSNLEAIFASSFFANYHPLTTLTYAFDRAVWGNRLYGFHLTHLAFYTAGVVVLYYALRRILRSEWAALAAAALYSAHALHTEVVAWLASRKDVVCLLFYAAALLLYARYAARRDAPRAAGARWPWVSYLAVLACSLLAMLSKGYAVVLPGVFIAYDLCFSPRFQGRLASEMPYLPGLGWFCPRARRVLLLDKAPVLLLALGVTVATALSQGQDSALLTNVEQDYGITTADRIRMLLKVFALYVGRALLPVQLNAGYVVGKSNWQPEWVAAAGAAALAAAAAGFFWWRNRKPAAAFGIALFVLPLATVMNTFFTLRVWMADRYLFLPTLGSALVLVAVFRGPPEPAARPSSAGRWRAGAVLAVVLLYALLTTARVRVWLDPVLLWSDALRQNYPVLSGEGRLTAKEIHDKLASLPLDNVQLFALLATAYEFDGDSGQARSIKQDVRSTTTGNLDVAQAELDAGHFEAGVAKFTALVEGGDWQAHQAAKALGDAYAKKGDLDTAREWYHKALLLCEKRGLTGEEALMAEGALEGSAKNYARAVELYRQLAAVAPANPYGPFYEGLALENMGQLEAALERYQAALDLNANAAPGTQLNLSDAHRQIGLVCQKLHRYEDAVRHFEECLRLNPDEPQRAAIEAAIAAMRQEPGG